METVSRSHVNVVLRFKMFRCSVPLCTTFIKPNCYRSISSYMPSMSWSWWFLPEAVTDHGSDPSLPAVFQFPQKQRNSTQVSDTCCWGDQKNGSEDDDHHVSWSSKNRWKPSFTLHSSPPAALDHAPELMAISPKQDTYRQRQSKSAPALACPCSIGVASWHLMRAPRMVFCNVLPAEI